ncbi:MAG: LIM and senescent cell antigen-like-containing domain protein 2 [Marteilia pararefringens]
MDSLFQTPTSIMRQDSTLVQKSSINSTKRLGTSKTDRLFKCHTCQTNILKHEEFKMVEIQEFKFHENCCKCACCTKQIDGELYCELDTVFCTDCYTDLFAFSCCSCQKPIISGSRMIYLGQNYHSDCFTCHSCNASLVDLEDKTIFQGQLYCSPCEKKAIQTSTKFYCDLCHLEVNTTPLSFVDDDGKTLRVHPHHLRCRLCDQKLNSFGQVDKNSAVCVTCSQEDKSKVCNYCGKLPMHRNVKFSGKIYHSECFKCSKCGAALSNDPMAHNGEPFCQSCYVIHAKQHCSGCTNEDCASPKMRLLGKLWGRDHPFCYFCDKKVRHSSKGFMTIDLNLVCSRCFAKFRPDHHISDTHQINKMQTYMTLRNKSK